ncbi:hypothetical protein AAG614_15325 [Citromicrobium bathyomarinum]
MRKDITQLEREKLVLEEQAARQVRPQRSFEHMFELALDFLSNPLKLWKSGGLEARYTALRLLFSRHLVYARNEGFRTPQTSSIFAALEGFQGAKTKMAETEGYSTQRQSSL